MLNFCGGESGREGTPKSISSPTKWATKWKLISLEESAFKLITVPYIRAFDGSRNVEERPNASESRDKDL